MRYSTVFLSPDVRPRRKSAIMDAASIWAAALLLCWYLSVGTVILADPTGLAMRRQCSRMPRLATVGPVWPTGHPRPRNAVQAGAEAAGDPVVLAVSAPPMGTIRRPNRVFWVPVDRERHAFFGTGEYVGGESAKTLCGRKIVMPKKLTKMEWLWSDCGKCWDAAKRR
jgi:hypothetical protein